MGKKSTNLNRYRKAAGPNAIADLMQHYGITAEELRAWYKKEAGTRQVVAVCPRCGATIDVQVSNYDNSSVCPACENDIVFR